MRHGTQVAYRDKQCRCQECVEWKRQYSQEAVKRAQSREIAHGTPTGYRYGCRCFDCKEAKRKENLEQNPRRKLEKRSDKSLKTPRPRRDSRLREKYGITAKDYEEMWRDQGGVCKTCFQGTEKALAVDHCHKTGRVRGLLCNGCNTALGMVYENPDTLRNLIAYLDDQEIC